jgi:hypothetical protein
MDQSPESLRKQDAGSSGWKSAHQRLSQMLMEDAGRFSPQAQSRKQGRAINATTGTPVTPQNRKSATR